MKSVSTSDDTQAGFALVVVLWFLVLMAAFVGPFALAARTSAMITANQHEKEKLNLLADGLTTLLADSLAANSELAGTLPLNSQPINCSTERIEISLIVQDQSGLIDLNAADDATITTGLRSFGVGEDLVQDLSAAVMIYRSYAASLEGLKPQAITIAGGLKRAPFESVVELTDFAPLARIDAAQLHATFTVHSGAGIVNRAVSPARLVPFINAAPGAGGQSQGLRRVSIEASARNRKTAIAGYAGYIVELSQGQYNRFRRVEQLFPGAAPLQPTPESRCPAWLASDVAIVAGEPT